MTWHGSVTSETNMYIVTFRFEKADSPGWIRRREIDPPGFYERKQAVSYAEDQARLSAVPVKISVEEKGTRRRLLTLMADGAGNFKSVGHLV